MTYALGGIDNPTLVTARSNNDAAISTPKCKIT